MIRKVGVIGAGVMGAGIAAHITNAGVPVVMLDIVPEGANDRNMVAAGAVQKLLKTEPAAFMHKRNARLIETGNVEDNLDWLAQCDWIVEAVVERLDVKHALYRKLDGVRKSGSIVSSNTSTIPLQSLVEGMPASFREDFLITHFFNPPRYMRLLEIVCGPSTRDEAAKSIEQFCDVQLGKGVVHCKDTPGFIGNRIGVYWIQRAVTEAMRAGLTVEEADAITGRPMGAPKTGVFGLSDLVGLDLLPHVLESMNNHLPADDPFREVSVVPDVIQTMIADGYTGRKGKGGFYRLKRDGSVRVKEAKDLETGDYRRSTKPRFESVTASRKGGLKALVEHSDQGGQYAWRVISGTLRYAAELVPTIADDIVAVDEAMRLGFNWDRGPFEMIDSLGTAWFVEKLEAEQQTVPALLKIADGRPLYRVHEGALEFMSVDGTYGRMKRAAGVAPLADVKRATKPLLRSGAASVWDIGDGVVCLEFHTKMNAIDTAVMDMIRKAIDLVKKDDAYVALVIHNEAANFSVGANIGLALFAINIAAWPAIEGVVREGQSTTQAIKKAPFPIVGAPSGMALGGGCEVLLPLRRCASTRRMLHGVGRGRCRFDPRLGRLQGDVGALVSPRKAPGRPDAASV